MGTAERPTITDIADRLRAFGHRVSFFRLVQTLLSNGGADAVPPGELGPPQSEVMKFQASLSLASSFSDVRRVRLGKGRSGRDRFDVTVDFMGLYGPASPLPSYFTTTLAEAEPIEEVVRPGVDTGPYPVARDFLDIFNHRAISYVWRAWRKYRYELTYDGRGGDPHSHRLLCLAGLGTRGAVEALGVTRPSVLRFLGLLTARPIPAELLARLLKGRFDVPVEIEEFRPRRVKLPVERRVCLGKSVLGDGAHLGARFQSVGGAFRVIVGPISVGEARRFLPGTQDFQQLVSLTRFCVKDPLEFDVLLRVDAAELPGLELSKRSSLPLGQLSWLSPGGRREGRVVLSTSSADPTAKHSNGRLQGSAQWT